MKKSKLTKTLASLLVATSLLAVAPISAHATWKSNSEGWWYTEGNSYATGWEQINGAWYFFGQDGYMKTGWIQDGANWYYMYDDGSMATNTTINGYTLSSTGAWTTNTNKYAPKNAGVGSSEGSTEFQQHLQQNSNK